ncbi:MAG: hypothetical protein E7378_02475 [Clostridiales bacterium]|nr:hypothetical protein [Clostridiales bacterium]
MEQVLSEIKSSIKAINEKVEKLSPELLTEDKTKISLIVNNLLSSIQDTDKKLLLSTNLKNIKKNLQYILNSITANQWDNNDTFLYEIIKDIAFLNNCNGKQNLQGYSQSVNKNISLLETKINILVTQLDNTAKTSQEQLKDFDSKSNSIKEQMSKDFTAHQQNLTELKKKHESELESLKNLVLDFKTALGEDKNNLQADNNNQILALNKKVDEEILKINTEIKQIKDNFQSQQDEKLKELENNINAFKNEKETRINDLVKLAEDQLGLVSQATFSSTYKEYADKFGKAAKNWYIGTILSMALLIGVSIWWFIFKTYTSSDYMSLIAKVVATIGIVSLARYCSLQASKNKVLETKLRKTQLQMATFDTFVANLDPTERTRLKVQLTELLINQKDWIKDDKNELNVVNDIAKILKKTGHKIEINSIKKSDREENNQLNNDSNNEID